MTTIPDGLAEDGKTMNDLESAKFTKDKDAVDVIQPTAKLIGLTKEQLEQYRNDPFWKAIRYSLFIAFWLIWLAMFVGAILIVVLSPKCPEIKWNQKMVNYKIFTLAYTDTDSPDGFGDFGGIKEKLADLKDLGISAIWPTPVLEFDKNKLGPESMVELKVSEQLGGEDGFKDLVKQVHVKEMKIIVDLPLTVSDTPDSWAKNIKDGINGNKDGIASLNLDNDQVISNLTSAIKRFLDYGIDGLSITSYGLFDSTGASKVVKKIREMPGAEQLLILSELPIDVEGDENYLSIKPLVDAHNSQSGLDALKEEMNKNLLSIEQNGTKQMWRLGSLDPNGRRIDQLYAGGFSNEQKQHISALFTAVQMFINGSVSVLYGEELGLLSGISTGTNKKSNRIIYPWNNKIWNKNTSQFFLLPEQASNAPNDFESQKNDPNSPLHLFKTIAKFRQNPDFASGKFAFEHSSAGGINFYMVKRYPSEDTFYVLVINWNETEKKLSHKDLPELLKGKKLTSVEVRASLEPGMSEKVDLSQGAPVPIKLGPYSAMVLDVMN